MSANHSVLFRNSQNKTHFCHQCFLGLHQITDTDLPFMDSDGDVIRNAIDFANLNYMCDGCDRHFDDIWNNIPVEIEKLWISAALSG